MPTGTIKKLVADKGFGFIRGDAGRGTDVFFHHSSVEGGGFEDLTEGQAVEYTIDEARSDKGPRAGMVRPV